MLALGMQVSGVRGGILDELVSPALAQLPYRVI
jgi:hypothetical protein